MRILEFKDYCSGIVLKKRICFASVLLLIVVVAYFSAGPKVAQIPGNRYLLFSLLKYNYTPSDYRKTFLKWELVSPLTDREKLIKTVKDERLYSYFRPSTARKLQKEGVWMVCGRRVVFSDSPSFRRLREGRFCVRLKNIGGKIFVDSERWK